MVVSVCDWWVSCISGQLFNLLTCYFELINLLEVIVLINLAVIELQSCNIIVHESEKYSEYFSESCYSELVSTFSYLVTRKSLLVTKSHL